MPSGVSVLVSSCSTWKEIEGIQEGDIVFFVNGSLPSPWSRVGVYFTTTNDVETQYKALQEVTRTDRRFSLRLISLTQYM